MFNIKQFQTEINKNGVMRNNRFLVNWMTPNSIKGLYDLGTMQRITMRCEAAQLPGMQFATIDGPSRLGYGPIESVPYGVAFEDVTLSFIIDNKSEMHQYFYDWVNSIVNFHSKGGGQLKDAKGPVQGMRTYEVGYKKDYSTVIHINMYDTADTTDSNRLMTARLYNAFPKSLPSVDVSWQAEDDIVKLNIPFSYTDYDIEYFQSPTGLSKSR